VATITTSARSSRKQFLTVSQRLAFLGYGACFVAGCLWGTGFYFGRLALNEMSVEFMVLYRFLFAGVGMLPAAVIYWRRLRLTRTERRQLLLCAFFGIPVQFLLQFHGLARTTVSHASLMVGAMPVLLALAAMFFAGKRHSEERLDFFGWIAISASTVGAALVVLGGSHASTAHGEPSLTGDLMVLASLCVSLAWILLSKKLMQTHSPTVVTAYTILSGTLMLAVWVLGPWLLSPLTRSSVAPPPFAHVSPTAWTALAISGLFCTATTTFLWNWGIHHVPASRAGVFMNIEPALGSWLGVKLLGEHLGPHAWVGGCLILAAAVTLTTRGSKKGAAEEPAVLLE
jgi:drug/metabolite transporter (DMT)-like permease